MDKETLDYLESLKDIIDNKQPPKVPDEWVWMEVYKCLVNNPTPPCCNLNYALFADRALEEFKMRFRE